MARQFDADDEAALREAVRIIREVMDKHVMELTTAITQRFNEAIDDILRARKMLENQ